MDLMFLMIVYISGLVSGDLYMHTPRGCNNRLNEQSANRNNANRLFDSQNNNRGGYNVGDLTDAAFNAGATDDNSPFPNGLSKGQYSMMFYEGSHFTIEWTNQHGCGGEEGSDPNKLNCNLVFQIGCQTKTDAQIPAQLHLDLKSGRNTNTPATANSNTDWTTQAANNDNNGRGRHETEGWYYQCSKMTRNKGLFLADQNVKGESAQYTRQNPNGNRRGLECPEERDYYPYWNPTPFMDLAVLTDNVQDCTERFNFQGNSQNNNNVCSCYNTLAPDTRGDTEECYNHVHNETECAAETGCMWSCYSHGIPAPLCQKAPWTRANSLGNGRTGRPTTLNVTMPTLVPGSIGQYTDIKTLASGQKVAKCIMRMRYNMTTDDYDPANTNASHNYDRNAQPEPIVSPVTQNPTVDIGLDSLQGLRLAINTNQFGRTFQDRSHTWYLMSKAGTPFADKEVHNMIVRGKRGNIVQTFPAVEYDFSPKAKEYAMGSVIHLQWTGSNTHNNGNPAGDGQAGDAGEGTTGTDRQNFVPIAKSEDNYPIPFQTTDPDKQTEYAAANIYNHMNCYGPTANPITGTGAAAEVDWSSETMGSLGKDLCALTLFSSGYYRTWADLANANKDKLSVLLNNAPASLAKGIVMEPTTVGSYSFMCTRNNNFSNRSQKGTITVAAAQSVFSWVNKVRTIAFFIT